MATTQKVNNVIAVNQDAGAGAVTWWRLTGVNLDQLKEGLKAIGIADRLMPTAIEAKTALYRALEYDVTRGRKLKVIPFEDADGFIVEGTRARDGHVEHWTVLKVLLKDNDQLHCWDCDARLIPDVEAAFARQRAKLDGYDVGMWLTNRMLPHLNAVTLRDRGGIYYVPPTTINLWQMIAGVIADVGGGKVFEMPAMECDKAVDAILDAVSREAEDAIEKMEKALVEEDLGAQALKNRVAKLDKVLSKVSSYEEMLGSSLMELHQRCEMLSAQMAAAIMSAEAAKDAEAASQEVV